MTILDRQIATKGKDENGQVRQASQEKGQWSQRGRQAPQRSRSSVHRRDQIGATGDFNYWNNPAAPRGQRKEPTHCDTNPNHHDTNRDDAANRGHLKPKGLSKSTGTANATEELSVKIALKKNDDIHLQLDPPTNISKAHDMSAPTTSNTCGKAPGRMGKKSGEKKVIHGKRKHRRNVPYGHSTKPPKHPLQVNTAFPLQLPQACLDDCASSMQKDQTNAACQYQAASLAPEKNPYATMEAIYNPRHFQSETSTYMHGVSHQEEYTTLHKPSRSKSNLLESRIPNEFNDAECEIAEARNNSDDEYDQNRLKRLNRDTDFAKSEEEFEKKLKKVRGFVIKPMTEDGACLFRAVADQIYGDQEMHDEVRKNCMNYMFKNADYFKNYVTEDFNTYVSRKRELHTFGNHLEMQAMAELYNRPFEVFQYTTEPINTFQTSHLSSNPPLRVSYHQNSHYNSVIDPYKATIGVGLGLPSFKPGAVETSMIKEAVKASQDVWEQQMLNDKVVATDWETTDDAILEQVARESYVEYIKQKTSKINEVGVKKTDPKKTPPRELCSPTAEIAKTFSPKNVVKEFPKKSNRRVRPGDSDWVAEDDEWEVLSQVLANSQQEYMDVLKQHAAHSKATCSKYT